MTSPHPHDQLSPRHRPDPAGADRSDLCSAPELVVSARDLRPGDFLPPQRALHGTPYRDDGFVVGSSERDVTQPAVLSGRMLVFGPHGALASLAVDTDVEVRRPLA